MDMDKKIEMRKINFFIFASLSGQGRFDLVAGVWGLQSSPQEKNKTFVSCNFEWRDSTPAEGRRGRGA
jgi:hypothetical protein